MSRHDGRRPGPAAAVPIQPDYLEQAHGSALVTCGKTIVLCTASVDDSVPRWMSGRGKGWMTAEYGMLPASTGDRTPREAAAASRRAARSRSSG